MRASPEQVRRLELLLRRELEAEGLRVEATTEDGEPVLLVGEMRVYPRRLLEGQFAENGDADALDLDWLAKAHRAYFRNLRRFHPSQVAWSPGSPRRPVPSRRTLADPCETP